MAWLRLRSHAEQPEVAQTVACMLEETQVAGW